ncbi:coiled-coil domain-containing protein 130 homolog [Melanotaenia boesemani]|uniref:coiled-coil domain-containing protein 130 homolog n=1 Tax=Melanotaenia boesemani TaxID=1250792 RepID=UPI001C04CB05|nr:coiled-coil domain-containing protein 130 homolog [Melanotaenia boesemani]XP_041838328.1 coiled-coil domain-containing protein 130 homolog [Melanotaenia boesemani]XP_041838329.1 coiled-coil domain-containing protein 130 homolog [Melanotaenia boesemani]XP_041838330.1 coiled-coil domain-containing protein 130 homolog [Melanotaenia boesemani]XP_041838331.1 coiled-coil domain-containing protein 130 homolog [Melanotaenia boesemani]XP_041838333.1 coiled-coil domain-containing protein 130 homolog 
MGERKGTNKYYPPDFDPAKHGSLNGYHKTHALRERARKLSQGILIIRFEMPYNIWCDGCKNHIGMGVRYNAEKKKVGNYYTTPIYRFRMKCHLCINYIEMQTDPATCDYVIVSGACRKEERWDMAENEQILTTERAEKEKLETDAMYKLDHGGKDKEKLTKALPSLMEIQEHQSGWKDDFQLNSVLRRKFRTEKKVLAEQEEKDNAVKLRTNLSIPLLPEKEVDKKLAALLTYQAPDSYEDKQHSKRKEIASRSWFNSTSAPTGGAAGSLLHKLSLQGKEAAVAKAMGSSHSPLIRKRTGGPGIKSERCATITHRKSHPEVASCDEEVQKVTQPEEAPNMVFTRGGEKEAQTNGCEMKEVHVKIKEEMDKTPTNLVDCGKEKDEGKLSGGITSLVADYSDSDSDAGH